MRTHFQKDFPSTKNGTTAKDRITANDFYGYPIIYAPPPTKPSGADFLFEFQQIFYDIFFLREKVFFKLVRRGYPVFRPESYGRAL